MAPTTTTTTTVLEDKVLRPRPATDDEDAWPIFELKDVEITSPESTREHNHDELWRADEAHPLTIVGTLAKPALNQKKYLLDSRNTPVPITLKIENCTHWSYGQYENGSIAFWAAGKSGWFEITPRQKYARQYRNTRQAIEMLYFLSDFYRERLKRKKVHQIPLDAIFAEYAAEPRYRCREQHEVLERFLGHKDVLLDLMLKGKEARHWNWQQTPVFKFLKQQSSGDAASREPLTPTSHDAMDEDSDNPRHARLAGKGRSALRPKSSVSKPVLGQKAVIPTSDSDDSMPDADEPLTKKRRRGRPRNLISTQAPPKAQGSPDVSPSDTSLSTTTSQQQAANTAPLPLRSGTCRAAPPQKKPAVRVSLVSDALPTCEPQGPGDTWTCPFDGCAHHVYGASVARSKELVHDHYAAHVRESQRQIDLVYAEERPYLPVNNLVKRIREIADGGGLPAGLDAAGAVVDKEGKAGFPKRIERKW